MTDVSGLFFWKGNEPMRVSCLAAFLSIVLGGSSVLAQAPAPQAGSPETPPPMPADAKVAFVNVQRVAEESAAGKESTAQVQALNQEKLDELNEKNRGLQDSQQTLQQGGTVMSETARVELEREIGRMQIEIQRMTEDAQLAVQTLTEELQLDFQRQLFPVIQQVAAEKSLQMVLSVGDSGILWADPGLDITMDVIQRFDAEYAKQTDAQPPQ